VVVRPWLYSACVAVPILAMALVGLAAVDPVNNAGVADWVLWGTVLPASLWGLVRAARVRLVIDADGVAMRRFGYRRFAYRWEPVEFVDLGRVPEGVWLGWRAPVLHLTGGKTVMLEECRALRHRSDDSTARTVARLVTEARTR
jgi:hypothetical protein